jgi:hypothetical protein
MLATLVAEAVTGKYGEGALAEFLRHLLNFLKDRRLAIIGIRGPLNVDLCHETLP